LVGGFAANQPISTQEPMKANHSERSEESKYFYRTTMLKNKLVELQAFDIAL
jgi:hypothetical protein